MSTCACSDELGHVLRADATVLVPCYLAGSSEAGTSASTRTVAPLPRASGATTTTASASAPLAQGAQPSPEPTSPPPAQGPRGEGEIGPG
ncbi:hypothetical protein WME97_46860 [Sorangium sp. So ce367]|uniref:hypothetical protein n=1 Tax=Sorangium sp. So ce367 TaxID=3133305 RepID=UPI003F634BF6